MVEVVLQARSPLLADMIQKCADGYLSFSDLERQLGMMGYRTTSLYEMVRAAKRMTPASVARPRER